MGGGGNPKNPPRFELFGIDINPRAIEFCKNRGLNAQKIDDIFSFKPQNECEKFDLIISTHCLEHIEKARVVPLLAHFREHLLREGGAIFIAVPNAQSFTNCYWAYEDFTHEGLFTAGSLIFVLKMAGFKSVEMIDLDALCGSRGVKKLVRKAFLKLYKINAKFWCKITASAYHAPSPVSYAYEIKALARK